MNRKTSCLAALLAAGAALAAAAPACADVLIDLTNFPDGLDQPYDLQFVATNATTTLTVAGYQVPSDFYVTDNDVFLDGGGPNLLGATWNFTPAAAGSDSSQYSDGSGVNELRFAGTQAGFYDTYTQSFATTVGSTYDYTFNLQNVGNPADGFTVAANAQAVTGGGVPEPATWAMLLVGFGGLGAVMRRQRTAMATA